MKNKITRPSCATPSSFLGSSQKESIPLRFRFFLLLYSGLWHLLKPVLRRHRRLKHGFDQRLMPNDWAGIPQCHATKTLWIQAASGGEALLAESIMSALGQLAPSLQTPEHSALSDTATQRNEIPSIEVVCTTCTQQGLEILNNAVRKNTCSSLRITPAYFPLDIPSLMEKALDLIRPDALILLETELWPGLLFSAKQKGIPLLVANGRMTEKSVSAYRFLRGFLSRFSPQWVMATSEENAQRFKHVFPHALVEEIANCKFDIAKKLLEKKEGAKIPTPHDLAGHTTDKGTVLLASVREEEEEILLQTVLSLVDPKNAEKKPLVIIAPRHLHRANAWMEMLTRHQIPSIFRSAFSSSQKASEVRVIIWDAFGELSSLYAYCDAIFVGGSFAPLGGQNFLEPLAFGKVPFVGPSLDNFLWVGKSIMQEKLVIQLATPEELAPALLNAIPKNTTTQQEAIQKHFSAWLLPRTGGSEAIAKKIMEITPFS